jgi:outer membrane protein OmpA-like peptidoglycan-associated protein
MARVVTKGGSVNVRSGAGTTFPIVGTRANGDQVDVIERRSGWVRIGASQWLSGDYVKDVAGGGNEGEVAPIQAKPQWPDGRILRAFDSGKFDLKSNHKKWLDGYAVSRAKLGQRFWICGLTSRLGGAAENQKLSERRATAVRDHLVARGVAANKIVGYVGEGEAQAGGSPTNDSPADRAVMVCITNDVVQLPPAYIQGKRVFSPIKWIEVNPDVPQLTLAGKTDTPASGRGDAVGALVTFMSNYLQDASINSKIQDALKAEDAVAQRLLPQEGKKGILFVVHMEERQASEFNTKVFRGGAVVGGPESDPKVAIDRYERTPQLEPGQSFKGKRTRRFFWGIRDGAR